MENELKNEQENNREVRKKSNLTKILVGIGVLLIIGLVLIVVLNNNNDNEQNTFFKKVESLVSVTNSDISNKKFDDTYTYTIENGQISDLDVKDITGMNGTIIYDKQLKEIYAIHNEKYCVKKTEEMDKAEISKYVEGECTVTIEDSDTGIRATLTSKVPEVGNELTSENGRLINLGEYGIRYQGSNPDNYIYFNCSDYNNQNSETCELWRIIGIVDGKVKLVKNESIGSMKWDYFCYQSIYNCTSDNNWSDSTLKTNLNGDMEQHYYANLSDDTKKLISSSTWYLRSTETSDVTKDTMYNLERTTGKVLHKIESIKANIGLMYPSDYGYAAMETDNCLATTTLTWYDNCKDSNWLANSTHDNNEWLITPAKDDSNFFIHFEKIVDDLNPKYEAEIRPSLYLKSKTEINNGEGTMSNPYQLKVVK